MGCRRGGGRLGGVVVLVDESAADVGAGDRLADFDWFRGFGVVGGALVDALMWPVRVVVGDVFVEEPLELAAVPDQGAVEEFVAHATGPSFGEGVGPRCAWWCGDDVGADGCERR